MKFSYRKKLVIVNLDILGKTAKFLIDTGSERSFFASNKQLDIFRKPLDQNVRVKGIGKAKIITEAYFIPRLIFDNKVIRNAEFLIQDKNLMFRYLGIDGIIGWDILKGFNFTIDFKNKYLSVGDIQLQKSYPYVSIVPDKQLVVQVGYNNKEINALIDLGANRSVISKEIMLDSVGCKWRRYIVFGINGIVIRKVAELSNIVVNFGNQNITVNNANVKSFDYHWLLKLGTDSFRQYKIYFNNAEREVLVIE
ncbi:retropepsin-like domain-containing protein [Streptococcus suis]|nr:retropepsin-like domain-containing protein [Streptococcus suis]